MIPAQSTLPARLPMPAEIQDLALWKILTSVIFPAAKDPATIILALRYCERRGLDVLKKPVNIVPVWNRALGRSVETIWPSITETEITASRSKQWAGLDAPVFGPAETRTFVGKTQISVSFPLWAERTVYRLIAGERRAFTERAHWLESYGRDGGSDAPNYMWAKRPFDQLAKVAKAAALRAAFPEESDGPTDAEADGMIIPGEDIAPPPAKTIDVKGGDRNDGLIERAIEMINRNNPSAVKPYTIGVDTDGDWRPFGEKLIAGIRNAATADEAAQWLDFNKINLETMAVRASKLHGSLLRGIDAAMAGRNIPSPPEGADAPPPPEGADALPPGTDPETGEYQ
jgi:phage recombination protein Bet